jgi:hypothetical protein
MKFNCTGLALTSYYNRNDTSEPNIILFHFFEDNFSFISREYEQLVPLDNTTYVRYIHE